MTFRVSGACCAMVLSVCLAAPTLGADKQAVEPAQPPLKVLLLPVDFDILEMSAGGMIGALVGWGIPEERVKHYEAGLKKGGILMGVKPRSDEDAEYLEQEWRNDSAERLTR